MDTEEYSARAKHVDRAKDLRAGLIKTLQRMRVRQDCPQWLTSPLDDAIMRIDMLIPPLEAYRDEGSV